MTHKADVYALGAILFRAVMGRHAFEAGEVDLARTKLISDPEPTAPPGRTDMLARGFAVVVDKAIRRSPPDRWDNALDMARELTALRDLARRLEVEEAPTHEEDFTPLLALKGLVR